MRENVGDFFPPKCNLQLSDIVSYTLKQMDTRYIINNNTYQAQNTKKKSLSCKILRKIFPFIFQERVNIFYEENVNFQGKGRCHRK